MTEATIYTLRHAQTTYGAQRRYAGSIDVHLSAQGVQDCLTASQTISRLQIDLVVTSTLIRSIETARLLGFDPAECVQTELCTERRFGILEGRTWEEARTFEPPILFISVGGELHSVNPAGAEPFEDVWQRAREFRDFLLNRSGGLSTLVVSHGVFLQMLHGVLVGSSCIESLGQYPASLELTMFRIANGLLTDEPERVQLGAAGGGF